MAHPKALPNNTVIKTSITLLATAIMAGISLGGHAAEPTASGQKAQAATTYPDKPITIVVTFPPGGGTDLLARKLGAELEAALGQPVIIDNRAGASGNIGASHVARSSADGYTLLMVNSSFAINPAVLASTDFDPAHAFTPVINVGFIPSVLVVPADSQAANLPDLLKQKRQTGKPLLFASCGNGTPQHLAGAMLHTLIPAIEMDQVPYKGCGPAVTDVLGGQVELGIVTASSAMPYLKAGRLRALGVTSPQRSTLLPQTPTVAEQGFEGYELDQWHGLLAPAGTEKSIIAKLNQVLSGAITQPQMHQQLQELGYNVTSGSDTSPEAFDHLVQADLRRFSNVVAGMKDEPRTP